jgi:hypothetical protein
MSHKAFDAMSDEVFYRASGSEARGARVAMKVAAPEAEPVPAPAPAAPAPPPPPPSPSPSLAHRMVANSVAPPREAVASALLAGESEGQDGSSMWPPMGAPPALSGELAEIERALARHDTDRTLAKARAWHDRAPGDVLGLIGYGDVLEAKGDVARAARIYGSIIDLFPARADMRRFAGERLARLANQQRLIVGTLKRAAADRPDHLTGRRMYAYALYRVGKPAEAFATILQAIDQPYRNDSYRGAQRVLADDAGMLGAAYAAAEPAKRGEIERELAKRNLALATTASTRFILYWETDGNDVDFHIQDARGGHAWYSHMQLESGGELYADVTTGYGPECFAIPGTPKAGPYRISINYYSQGPMGYGMGLLEIQRFDGGKLTFEDRPYVIMNDHAYVDLGTYR